jgi:hypothetical protein
MNLTNGQKKLLEWISWLLIGIMVGAGIGIIKEGIRL